MKKYTLTVCKTRDLYDPRRVKLRHSALITARDGGTRSVSHDAKTINYGTDAGLAAAIRDIEQRIAKVERGASRVLRPFAVKDL